MAKPADPAASSASPPDDADEERATEQAREVADELLRKISAAAAVPLPAPASERREHTIAAVPTAVDLRSTDSRVKIDPDAVSEALPRGNPADITIPPNRAFHWSASDASRHEAETAAARGGAPDGGGPQQIVPASAKRAAKKNAWRALAIALAVVLACVAFVVLLQRLGSP